MLAHCEHDVITTYEVQVVCSRGLDTPPLRQCLRYMSRDGAAYFATATEFLTEAISAEIT